MAKEPEEEETETTEDEAVEEVAETKSKKKPAKPKKEGGDTPILLMIGGALGAVVLIIVSVIIGTLITHKLFFSYPTDRQVVVKEKDDKAEKEDKDKEDEEEKKKKEDEEKEKKLPPIPDDLDELDVASKLLSMDDWYTIETAKITSNTRGSMNWFAIARVSINYKAYYKEELERKGFLVPAKAAGGGEGGHGGAAPAGAEAKFDVDQKGDFYKQFSQTLTAKINDFLSTHTAQELQANRLNLSTELREFLKQTFKEYGLIIGEVKFLEWMVAQN